MDGIDSTFTNWFVPAYIELHIGPEPNGDLSDTLNSGQRITVRQSCRLFDYGCWLLSRMPGSTVQVIQYESNRGVCSDGAESYEFINENTIE